MGKRHRTWQQKLPALAEMAAVEAAANAMTASGNEPRKHHLVPGFYLDRWAIDNRVRVTRFDGEAKTTFTPNPDSAARETDYYRFDEGRMDGSPVYWEAFLSKLEGQAATIVRRFDDEDPTDIDYSDWVTFAWFLAMQITRGSSYRAQAKWIASRAQLLLYKHGGDASLKKKLRDAGQAETEENIARLREHLSMFEKDHRTFPIPKTVQIVESGTAAKNIVALIGTRQPVVYETYPTLITCDNPVVELQPHMGDPDTPLGGLARAAVLAFPLDSSHVLALFRADLQIPLPSRSLLTHEETLELNRAILGNVDALAFERPDRNLTNRLYVPEAKLWPEPAAVAVDKKSGGTVYRLGTSRRWHNDPLAPVLPVARWWELPPR